MKNQPTRTCLGCRELKPKNELLRIVKTPDGDIKVDISSKLSGRGTYICKSDRCVKEGLKKDKIAKALKVDARNVDIETLGKEIKKYY